MSPRKSICVASPAEPHAVIHQGHPAFVAELGRLYTADESNAIEELSELKRRLRATNSEDFWSMVSERMAEILGAQMSFIAKRILVDEQDTAIEMPPLGEEGSCLMAAAWYYNDQQGNSDTLKGIKYHAWGCPCAYMRHDKVFIVTEKLGEIFAENPNKLPVAADSYIGIPLFADGKCFAHFGLIWSTEGSAQRRFSWPFVELFMHSLEDLILQRLLEGSSFVKPDTVPRDPSRIIPHEVITAAQSLQPYAKSLSHELRTPMQGVVGMLDVMYATVQEAAEGQTDPEIRKVFELLKENIEVVQDSSRRAVEAADNVVHAYDMNMAVPTGPSLDHEESAESHPEPGPSILSLLAPAHAAHPEILVAGSDLPITRPNKRRREYDQQLHEGSPTKLQATLAARAHKSWYPNNVKAGFQEAEELPERFAAQTDRETSPNRRPSLAHGAQSFSDRAIAPGVRHTDLRQVLQYVVNEGLKVGGRPDSAIARETRIGEIIEVVSRNGSGEPRTKVVEWSVDPAVHETVLVDEKDLAKLVSCVFLNAVKFTDQGHITVSAKMSPKGRYVVIKCVDTGPGIPAAFLPRLFQPFSQEDPSLTRQSEGLGLGLLVAKGIARKLGGDLFCIRADTSGPKHGTEFEMRVPVTAGETVSRPVSPFGTPQPNRTRHSNSLDSDGRPSPTPAGGSVRRRKSSGDSARHVARPETPAPITVPAPESEIRTAAAVMTPNTEKHQIQFTMPPPAPAGQIRPHTRNGRKASATLNAIDRNLAAKHPLTFLVAEDNKINRKLLVSMLMKFGYKAIHEAYDGAEAVRQMSKHPNIDVVLMDLWMPFMDGYEATEKILAMHYGKTGISGCSYNGPTVLAVTADVTDGALERAAQVGMKGFMTKPFKLMDLQRLILEYCASNASTIGSDGSEVVSEIVVV